MYLSRKKICILHVGNMKNRGTQALITTDVKIIKKITDYGSDVSISTTDINGVKNLSLPVENIVPPFVDIPFEKADDLLRKLGYKSRNINYLIFSLFYFLSMIMQSLITIFSSLFFKIGIKPIFKSDLFNIIKNCDLIVSCSDENFKEGSVVLPLNVYWLFTWWSLLFSRLWDISIARYFGKPIIMFPNSVGPFKTPIGRFLTRVALNNCKVLLLREPISLDFLKEINVHSNMILTGDIAMLYEENLKNDDGNKKSNIVIGVSPGYYAQTLSKVNIMKYLLSHARTLDRIIEIYDAEIRFLPHYISGFKGDDLDVSEKIFKLMKNKKNSSIILTKNLMDFKKQLNFLDVHISSKMHPTILATSSYIPTVSIVYDHKQVGYYKLLNMEEYLIDLLDINERLLFNKLDSMIKNKILLEEKLRIEIPVIKENTVNVIEKIFNKFVKE